MRVAMTALVWSCVFFPLRVLFLRFARPSDVPDLLLALLAFGVGLIAADFAGRAVELRSVRGALSFVAVGGLTQRAGARVALIMLALLSSLYILIKSLFVVVITAMSFFAHHQPFIDLTFHVIGWLGILGVWAVWSRIFVSHEKFRNTARLRALTGIGLTASLLTAVFFTLGVRPRVPLYGSYLEPFAVVLLIDQLFVAVVLLVVHIAAGKAQEQPRRDPTTARLA